MDLPCQSKVNQLHVQNVLFCLISDEIKSYWTSALDQHCHKLSNLCEHDVVGLDVQVEDVSHVQVLQSLNHLKAFDNQQNFFWIKWSFNFLAEIDFPLYGRNEISTSWKKWNFQFSEDIQFPLLEELEFPLVGRNKLTWPITTTHLASVRWNFDLAIVWEQKKRSFISIKANHQNIFNFDLAIVWEQKNIIHCH